MKKNVTPKQYFSYNYSFFSFNINYTFTIRKQYLNIPTNSDLLKFSEYDYEKKIFINPCLINEFNCPNKLQQ